MTVSCVKSYLQRHINAVLSSYPRVGRQQSTNSLLQKIVDTTHNHVARFNKDTKRDGSRAFSFSLFQFELVLHFGVKLGTFCINNS